MKLSISTTTANRRFVKALRRQQGAIENLKRLFEGIAIDDCTCKILLLAFVDRNPEYFKIIPGEPDLFEVEVGYDAQGGYPVDDDVLLIQLLEEKLIQMIDACDALGDARNRLRDLVVNWTTQVITP